ncbi:hypothetical protein ATK36_0135 [Amycolatopsis sulphurea]|uniref:Uncharacterized protein n=1 Tax=Amycolatopsis sulphurea TaxID=76022 RepID=A0A2A9G0Y6_9PSEU|nr:hypothetical protein [Amycolatopsis sulphurea]PFG56616.1 hypothetical protein ATK36_0135 [Amycolatopsis sulphurea]
MLATWMRALGALGLAGSAAVHFILYWHGGYSEIAVVGPLFLVNGVAGVLIAVALLTWRHWLPAFLTLGFGGVTLLAYLLSVTVGFYGVHDQFTSQYEYWGVITEAVCVLCGLVLLGQAFLSRRTRRPRDRTVPVGR